jgi:MFS family permease
MKADVNIFGYLEAAFSGGVVLGGLLLPFITELLGTKRVFTFLLLLLTGSLFLFSLSNNVIISCFMYGLIGASFSSWTLIMSKMQALTDMKFQGRLYSIFNSLGGLFVIITYLILIFYGSAITITKGYWIEAMIAIIALTLFNLHLKQIKYEYTT